MRTIVLATTNPGKAREYRALLGSLPARLVRVDEVGLTPGPETGDTFAENAAQKALHAAAASGLVALADDSGLEVDGLGGAPGVRSARYAGEGADDEANRRRLIEELAGVPVERRTARFRCAVAVARPDDMGGGAPSATVVALTEGTCEGLVQTEPRGANGFGYDPLFLPADRGAEGRTMAELSPEEKNAISHRARALERALPALRALVAEGCGLVGRDPIPR